MGHARALLALNGLQQSQAAQHIVQKQLTVRATEHYIKQWLKPPSNSFTHISPDVTYLTQNLAKKLQARVHLTRSPKGQGKITIYYSSQTLETLLRQLNSVKLKHQT